MRPTIVLSILPVLCSLFFSLSLFAKTPEPNNHWKDWILEEHEEIDCPWVISSRGKQVCHWPSKFIGQVTESGMSFEMTIDVFSKSALVTLPGDKKHWPNKVTVNQKPAGLLEKSGVPSLKLTLGKHFIRGEYIWENLPSSLRVNDDIALIEILKNGVPIATSINNNQLILSVKKRETVNTKNALKVQVYRALVDDVPLKLNTLIKLSVSGKSREVTLGNVMLEDSKALYLNSSLPARLEDNGTLRIQVKPGVHEINIGSRLTKNITTLTIPKHIKNWPDSEYISFIANAQLREVQIKGGESIDTSLVNIPHKWSSYPTYRVQQGESLTIAPPTYSVDVKPQNSINITRNIWLAFDGKSAIAKDVLTGEMSQGWRLDAHASMQPGQASVNGNSVLITQLAGNNGVEIRSSNIDLTAVSTTNDVRNINAVGWKTDVNKLTTTIHLPPGWRAIHATGVDGVNGTWLEKWNLWDIFWLMILIAAANKLLGIKGAVLMSLTLIFSFHEIKAPTALWATLLFIIALLTLPKGRHSIWLSRLSVLPALSLIIAVVAFSTESFRLAAYPTLEKQGNSHYRSTESVKSKSEMKKSVNSENEAFDMFGDGEALKEMSHSQAEPAMSSKIMRSEKRRKPIAKSRVSSSDFSAPAVSSLAVTAPQNLYQIGENDRVQTGPGVPTWHWNTLRINSAGSSVTMQQQINVLYSPPLVTALWRILNALLISLMAAMVLHTLFNKLSFSNKDDDNNPDNDTEKQAKNGEMAQTNSDIPTVTSNDSSTRSSTHSSISKTLLLIPLLATFGLMQPQTANANVQLLDNQQFPQYPPEYLLNEYEQRLLTPPDCLPECVSLNNGFLEIKQQNLHLSFNVYADTNVALPLPSAGNAWQATQVYIDDIAAVLRKQRGQLFIFVPQGQHKISLRGDIVNDVISLNLPLNIHNFTVNSPAWQVDGIFEGNVLNNTIGLSAKKMTERKNSQTLTPIPIKSYAVVHRSINLGKEWTITTRVEKTSPVNETASFNIKLLKGEQILFGYPVNENGFASVQIPKNQRFISWTSSLEPVNSLQLTADTNSSYAETWSVIPLSSWHVIFSGIKPLKSESTAQQLQPTWKPWPGEVLTLNITRPEGILGEIFTTEKAVLTHNTGKSLQRSTLLLTVRTSQASSYEMLVNEPAKITGLKHNQQNMGLSGDNRAVVQLNPGVQTIELSFQHHQSLAWSDTSPMITLPGNTANIHVNYQLAEDRWLLYLNGPTLGASMLYWGMLMVIIIGAFILPIISRKLSLNVPLKTGAWLLLGLGFSTVNQYGVVLIALLFFVMACRSRYTQPEKLSRLAFNALQLALVALTFISITSLLVTIPMGLLYSPDMQVVGNGSYGNSLKFFQDQAVTGKFPTAQVISLPLWVYRIVMLLWSLWIATQLFTWAKWWFTCFSAQETWKNK